MICAYCGLDKTDVCERVDLYLIEICGYSEEDAIFNLCEDCFEQRAMDV